MDPAEADAAAERLLAMHRLRQAADTHGGAHQRVGSRVVMVAIAALMGAGCGAMLGALRGHAVAGAMLVGLVGVMLALIGSRPR